MHEQIVNLLMKFISRIHLKFVWKAISIIKGG
jgi:hypothetical protein